MCDIYHLIVHVGLTSPTLPLVDGLISLMLFSVSKFEGQEKDHVLFRGTFHYCGAVQKMWLLQWCG